MPTATSLKLPGALKSRVTAVAEAAGKTPHAFMIDAIEQETTRAERHDAFVAEALRAERELNRTGLHFAAEDVFRYMTARAGGKSVKRPRPKRWRR